MLVSGNEEWDDVLEGLDRGTYASCWESAATSFLRYSKKWRLAECHVVWCILSLGYYTIGKTQTRIHTNITQETSKKSPIARKSRAHNRNTLKCFPWSTTLSVVAAEHWDFILESKHPIHSFSTFIIDIYAQIQTRTVLRLLQTLSGVGPQCWRCK